LIGLFFSFYFTKKIFSAPKLGFALFNSEDKELGYVATDSTYKSTVGKKGISKTMLRPTGNVMIEGDIYQATTESSFIDANTEVVVVKEEKNLIIVRKIDDNES